MCPATHVRRTAMTAASSVRTFIVEDSPLILDRLTAALEELAPVQVVGTASDESDAIGWLAQPDHAADLIIVDIFLKSGTGVGVLRTLARLAVPGKRVVLTNYATPAMRRICLELGADRIFDKSSELEDLVAYCEDLHRSGDAAEASGNGG
jgi:DNA-binding NarL/FixJ family response regulator